MTSTNRTTKFDSSSTSTLYYPPPAPVTGNAANPIDILPRRSTSATVTFVGGSGSANQDQNHDHDDEPFTFTENHILPPPGPAHFHERRRLWLTPPTPTLHPEQNDDESSPTSNNPTEKIAAMIASASSIASEDLWNRGLRTLSQGLLEGHRLRKPLGMDVVIKILHATWLRDGTWPPDTIIPQGFSDDEILEIPPSHPTPNGKPTQTEMPAATDENSKSIPSAMVQDDVVNGDGDEEDLASEGELNGAEEVGETKPRVVER